MNQADQFCNVCDGSFIIICFYYNVTVFDLPLNGMKKFMFYDGSFLFDMFSW